MGKIATDATLQELLTLLRSHLDTQQSTLTGNIGTLASLTTSAKTSLVAAINELVSGRGALSGLSTSAKNTLVAAINEVLSKANTANSDIDALKARATAIENVNSSQATSISTINARTLGIVNGSPHEPLIQIAPMHNSIFRGKRLGKFTKAHSDAIKNGSFSDIYLGDFFTDSTGYDRGYVVIGFDWFSAATHHLVLICNGPSVPRAIFNDTATTAGGYVDSKWRKETKPAFEAQIAADFIDDSHLWKHSEFFVSAVDANGNATGYVEKSDACVEMFDEMQICGMRAYHTCEKNAAGVASAFNRQFPYFRFVPWGWRNGNTLTRTILNSSQIRMLYNRYTGRAESAAYEGQTYYYFTVN